MSVPYRPLGHLRETVAELGLEVTYVFEDLVLIEHNAFLFQMGEQGEDVRLFFNRESLHEDRDTITNQLQQAGRKRQLQITRKGMFMMESKPDETIDIRFLEE